MMGLLKASARLAIAFVLGFVFSWFVLSFAWSLDTMTLAEKIVGVVYAIGMMPLYEGAVRVLKLQ